MSGCAFHAGIVGMALALWVLVGLPLGTRQLRDAETAWSDGFLSEQQYQARYPRQEHDETALQLDAVARRLGTYLAVTPEDTKKGAKSDTPELKAARDFMVTVRKADGEPPPRVPPEVARTVTQRRAEIEAIERLLTENPPVVWRRSAGGEWTVGLLGARSLHSLVLVHGLLADERGAFTERDRALEAAWQIDESLWRRPVLIDRLLAVGLTMDLNACLRRFTSLPAIWEERLASGNRLPLLAESLQDEARSFSQGATRLAGVGDLDVLTEPELPRVGAGGWMVRVLSAPYVRLSVAGYSTDLRRETARLVKADPCALDMESYSEEVKASLPAWNILSKTALPPVLRSWVSFRNAGLDGDLSLAVLRARKSLQARQSVDRRTPSMVCPAVEWITETEGGTVFVEADGGLPDAPDGSPRLDYAFRAR